MDTVTNPVLNVGREVCVQVTPLFGNEPLGWAGVELIADKGGDLFVKPFERDGLCFYAMPLPQAQGQVNITAVFSDGDKVILKVPYVFTLIAQPGKAKPNGAMISASVAGELAVGG